MKIKMSQVENTKRSSYAAPGGLHGEDNFTYIRTQKMPTTSLSNTEKRDPDISGIWMFGRKFPESYSTYNKNPD